MKLATSGFAAHWRRAAVATSER